MDDTPSKKAAKSESTSDRVEGAELAGSETGAPAEPKKLTPEEQMALYEDDLKENDWGHQPC